MLTAYNEVADRLADPGSTRESLQLKHRQVAGLERQLKLINTGP